MINTLVKIHIVNLLIKHPTDNAILVVIRADSDETFGGMFAMPGGHIENGETVQEAAARELLEETNGVIKSIESEPFLVSPLWVGKKMINIGLYKCNIKEGELQPNTPDISEVKYVLEEELLDSMRKHNYPRKELSRLEVAFEEMNK